MNTQNELLRAKEELTKQRLATYSNLFNGVYSYEVSPGKTLMIGGGINVLVFLQSGYEAHFNDPDVPALSAKIQQVDGTYTDCLKSEWETLFKAMRAKGSEIFSKNEALTIAIAGLTESDSFATIWGTTFENMP